MTEKETSKSLGHDPELSVIYLRRKVSGFYLYRIRSPQLIFQHIMKNFHRSQYNAVLPNRSGKPFRRMNEPITNVESHRLVYLLELHLFQTRRNCSEHNYTCTVLIRQKEGKKWVESNKNEMRKRKSKF